MTKILQEKCIGCGACAAICPEIFEMDEETYKAKIVSQKEKKCCEKAIEACPVNAIKK
jgi:ferredoxin